MNNEQHEWYWKGYNDAKKSLAQPAVPQGHEQEPVAWTDGPHLVMRTDWRDRANYKGPWVDIGRAIPDSWVPVFYTTPPQRKPLTDEQIEDITADIHGLPIHSDDYAFARAIEAAHGIMSDTDGKE